MMAAPISGEAAWSGRSAYRWAVDEFAAPEARSALPGMLAELSSSPQLAGFIRAQVIEPESARVRGLLASAQRRGEIRADADPQLAIDAFIGTALARATLLDRPLDDDFAERLVDLLVTGLAPRAGPPVTS
jgi:hypothetical protein